MENFEQSANPLEGLTVEQLEEKKSELLTEIERKRAGRKAMVEEGMEVESEEDDMDMQDLRSQISTIETALNPAEYSNQSELNLG